MKRNRRALLDTQTFLTMGVEGLGRVPAKVRTLVEDPEVDRVFSTVTITEIESPDERFARSD